MKNYYKKLSMYVLQCLALVLNGNMDIIGGVLAYNFDKTMISWRS